MGLPFDQSVQGMASLVGVLLFMYIATVILRFVARKRQDASLLADDWLVIPGLICFIGLVAIAIYGMSDKFIGYPTPADKTVLTVYGPIMKKVYWAVNLMSIVGLSCIRLSAIFFYRRIFCSDRQNKFNLVTWFMVGVVCLWGLAYFLLTWLVCGVGPNYWQVLWAGGPQCVTYSYLISMGITSFALDFFIIILPLPMIWSLHTKTSKKITISTVFLLAAAGAAASCARMVIYIKLWQAGLAKNKIDAFAANTHGFYYQVLEQGLCGVAINLPSLWYFCSGIRPESVLRSVRSLVSLRSSSSKSTVNVAEKEKGSSVGSNSQHSLEPNTAPGAPSRRDRLEYSTPPTVRSAYHDE